MSGNIKKEIKLVKKYGGQTIFTSGITFSSSQIIRNNFDTLDKKQKNEIIYLKKKFNIENIKKILKNIENTNISVIGETILDHYIFCEALGKASKDSTLVVKKNEEEILIGGAAAIANNLAKFTKKVQLFSFYGKSDELNKIIKSKLKKNIVRLFINLKDRPTILKSRLLDKLNNNKIIGIYNLNDDVIKGHAQTNLLSKLRKNLGSQPLIVADYGHGLLSKKILNYICSKKNFVSVNAQINSSSIGYHNLLNYKKVNLIVINEKEIRFEMRDRNSKIEILMKKLLNKVNCKLLVVTRGNLGLIAYDKKNFFYSNAYAKEVLDKIGAGDTILFLLSILIFNKVDIRLALFLSSIAAALNVRNYANLHTIEKNEILKIIENLYKI